MPILWRRVKELIRLHGDADLMAEGLKEGVTVVSVMGVCVEWFTQ